MLGWALAAQWWGIPWVEFQRLPGSDQAFLVAVYQTNVQIDAVVAYDHRPKRSKPARSQ